MNIKKVESFSLKGLRETNEDYIIDDYVKNSFNCFGIFDGHGGDDVSCFLHKHLFKYIFKPSNQPLNKPKIIEIFNKFNSIIKKKLDEISDECGSTALLLMINDDNIIIVNSGDCRAVLCKNGLCIQLTKDHKPGWFCEKQRIDGINEKLIKEKNDKNIKYIEYDEEDEQDRIGGYSVSRSFGDFNTHPYITCEPDIYFYHLNKKDKFIIMACDGLWDVMDGNEACNIVLDLMNIDPSDGYYIYKNKKITFDKKIENYIAFTLAKIAFYKNSTDNISVVIIFFN
jgi:serine/threonine protein phosphatase PrpC